MPTANRRAFVPRAVGHFLRQDYPHKELVILDDGADSVSDLIPDDVRVRYVRAERKQPIGAKRNACVELTRGDLNHALGRRSVRRSRAKDRSEG
jgi:glycosyltransferase involved in cell wall biosynthesis